MNSIMENNYNLFELYLGMRPLLIDLLDDDDLAFSVKGNDSIGALCKGIGETEHSYIQGFKTLKQDFSYRNTDSELTSSVEALNTWYSELDAEFKSTIEAFTQDEVDNQKIDRDGWEVDILKNLQIYQEALLIFYGKAWVYLNAMGKELPKQWKDWIG